jgi:putative lipoic acid-binding regulatory protein
VNVETLFDFPCDFPIKIVGLARDNFRQFVLDIVRKHVGDLADERVVSRPSRDGKYLSLTCTFCADSRAQVDGLYSDLTSRDRILMVL